MDKERNLAGSAIGTAGSTALEDSGEVTLVVVHPSRLFEVSGCPGSARKKRLTLVQQLNRHVGPLYIIDSCESLYAPWAFSEALSRGVRRAWSAGFPAARVWGCYTGLQPRRCWDGLAKGRIGLIHDGETGAAAAIARSMAHTRLEVTGVQADCDEGAVDGVAQALVQELPDVSVEIRATAVEVPRRVREFWSDDCTQYHEVGLVSSQLEALGQSRLDSAW